MGWKAQGSDYCRIHVGGTGARRKAELRALETEMAKTMPGFEPVAVVDPSTDLVELALRRITQADLRADAYAAEIRRLVAESPTLEQAVIRDAYGEFGKIGEFARGLVTLENAERERIMNWTFKALTVGIEAKRVELAASAGSQIAAVLAAVRAHPALALTAEQRAAFGSVVREVLGLTVTGPAMREIEGEHG